MQRPDVRAKLRRSHSPHSEETKVSTPTSSWAPRLGLGLGLGLGSGSGARYSKRTAKRPNYLTHREEMNVP